MNNQPSHAIPSDNCPIPVDLDYLRRTLVDLLAIHSPSGYTDPIARRVVHELEKMGVGYELTRRGAIRATLPGDRSHGCRAMVAHLDTLGAMVSALKPNGRLALKPIGTWSSRFAEGARVSVFTDTGILRGTILPLQASGHIFDEAVDTQPTGWSHVELRIDEHAFSKEDLLALGLRVGDFVGVDSSPELLASGYINAKHLDDKAGVALLLAAVKNLCQGGSLPMELHVLFTITEEVGSGASAVLRGDVAEMVTIDNGTVGPGQESSELWPSVCLCDSSGPFDYHLSRYLLSLCRSEGILHGRDLFAHYRSDSASAVDAGNDIRTALVTFGVDASHGYERTHIDSLRRTAQLLTAYARSAPLFPVGEKLADSLENFPETRTTIVRGLGGASPAAEA